MDQHRLAILFAVIVAIIAIAAISFILARQRRRRLLRERFRGK